MNLLCDNVILDISKQKIKKQGHFFLRISKFHGKIKCISKNDILSNTGNH